jgi:hypothetical protein
VNKQQLEKGVFQMKNKRVFVIGVTLILLALVATVAFAVESKDGVFWVVIQGRSNRLGSSQSGTRYIEVYNDNDYPVRVTLNTNDGTINGDYDFAAKETKHFDATSGSVRRVVRR